MRTHICLATLVLAVLCLVASNVKADLVQYEDAGGAFDAGLAELFTVTFSGTTRAPGVNATPGVTVTVVNNGVTWTYDSGAPGFSGSRTRGEYTLRSFSLDTGSLFEGYDLDILGYALTGVSFATGNGATGGHLRNVAVNADGGSFELYTWRTSNTTFWIEGSQTNQQSNFAFTVTYYGHASQENVVPEPATLVMLGLAAAGLPVVRKLRRG